MRGIYESWKLPGDQPVEGRIGAREAKAVGAVIYIAGPARRFKVYHHDNWGDLRFPWVVYELVGVGSRGGDFTDEYVDDFASLSEARAHAIEQALPSGRRRELEERRRLRRRPHETLKEQAARLRRERAKAADR